MLKLCEVMCRPFDRCPRVSPDVCVQLTPGCNASQSLVDKISHILGPSTLEQRGSEVVIRKDA